MLFFSIGMVVGLLLASIAFRNSEKIKEVVSEVEIKNPLKKKGKVEIIAPADEEAEAIGMVIQQNEERGLDTHLDTIDDK